jgi:hypothetical protein
MDLQAGALNVTARISQYDRARQEYSAVFAQEGEERSFDNLVLNKSILRAYADDPAISEDQNDRLRRIITSLGIFLSLRQAVGGEGVTVLSAQPAAVEDFWTALPAVSFALSVILPNPSDAAGLKAETGTCGTAQIQGAVGSLAAPLGAWVKQGLEEIEEAHGQIGPAGQTPQAFSVTITKEGESDPVDADELYYIERNTDLVFNFAFSGFDETKDVRLFYYEPNDPSRGKRFIQKTELNAYFYTVTHGFCEATYQVKVHRGNSTGTGYDGGFIDFVIDFGETIIINDSEEGIDFWDEDEQALVPRRDLFVLHFTVVNPDPQEV